MARLPGALALLVLVACQAPTPPPGSIEDLASYLQIVAGADESARLREARFWQLDQALWDRTVIASYRPLYAAYQAAFAQELPAIVARLAPGPVTARRHYAGDPRLTRAQARDRWALPPLFPSLVAELGGQPIDTVFIADAGHWRALIGLDRVVLARVAQLAPSCVISLERAGPTGRCAEISAAITDAAIRTDRERLAHVCQLAETLCGNQAP